MPPARGRLLALLVVLLSTGLVAEQPSPVFSASDAIGYVQLLASPEMRGRRTGTPDGARAAAMIAERFERAGLEPAGDDGTYRQAFPFPFYQIVAPSRLAVREAHGVEELRYGPDYYLLTNTGTTAGHAPLVYAGHGLPAADGGDYRGLDVAGRIVVALEGAPAGSPVPAAARSNLAKARNARERGARGILLVPQASSGKPLRQERIWVFRPSNYLDGFLFARISSAAAARLLGTTGRAADGAPDPLSVARPFASARTVEWEARVELAPVRVGHNVLGRLPGVDPALRDEVVIVGAHYDGGGVDPDGTVYPGAEDNASGTGALLALADATTGLRPKRTILFAAWGAEEQGVWGSRAFVGSAGSLERIAATITLDNVGVGGGKFRVFGARNFPDEYRVIAESLDATLAFAFTPRGAGGSDGYTFQILGIPSFFLHADAPQPHVHTPSDTPETMARASFESLARYLPTALMKVADAPAGYIRPDRHARYLARYAVVAGWAQDARQDWPALRARGFDIVLVPAGKPSELDSVRTGLDEGILVRDAASLQGSEEGLPLRVVPYTSASDAAGSAGGIVALRSTSEGLAGPGLRIVRVTSANLGRTVFADGRNRCDSDDLALIIDVAADGLTPADVAKGLLEAGCAPDQAETLLGGRLQQVLGSALLAASR